MDNNLLKLAENGDAEAQYKVGMAYHNGDGVEKNDATAAGWLAKSLAQNYPPAFGTCGEFYMQGIGVAQDPKFAASLFSMGAEAGDIHSIYRLGWVYWYADSYTEAIPYLERAAEGGSAPAKCLLGKSYFNGKGVPEDKAKALEMFEEAANDGDAEAQYMAASCYGLGFDTEINIDKALYYCKMSAEQGHADAVKNLAVFQKAKEDPQAYMQQLSIAKQQNGSTEKPANTKSNPPETTKSYESPKSSSASSKKSGSWGVAILLLLVFVPVGIWYIVTHEM